MKIPQCQLPGYIVMFETPLKMAAQLLRHYPSLTQCQTQCQSDSVSRTQCQSDSVSQCQTQCQSDSVSRT